MSWRELGCEALIRKLSQGGSIDLENDLTPEFLALNPNGKIPTS